MSEDRETIKLNLVLEYLKKNCNVDKKLEERERYKKELKQRLLEETYSMKQYRKAQEQREYLRMWD